MIEKIISGDITSARNKRDIIIGMNTELDDVTGIGLNFVANVIPRVALQLGSVISFDFDVRRKLHMLICHELGKGGWANADKYVRFGMDYLDHMNDDNRRYSIVQIGTGRIGKRDGANASSIHAAMAASFLPVHLYVYDGIPMEEQIPRAPLRLFNAWNPNEGAIRIAA